MVAYPSHILSLVVASRARRCIRALVDDYFCHTLRARSFDPTLFSQNLTSAPRTTPLDTALVMSLKRVNGASSLQKLPAMTLKMIPEFDNLDDACLQGKHIRQILHGRIDSKGRDVSGFFVPMDVVKVVLGVEKMDISVDIAPSLCWVDNGKGGQIPVVRAADLNAVVMKNQRTNAVVSVASAVQPAINPVEGHGVLAVQKPPAALAVLPDNTFIVSSSNYSMYGKKMCDVHIARFSVNSNTVIRFRKSDHKVVVADMLVGVGRYDAYNIANRAIQNFIAKKDDKISDLTSVEVDKTLSVEQVNICLYYYILIGTNLKKSSVPE